MLHVHLPRNFIYYTFEHVASIKLMLLNGMSDVGDGRKLDCKIYCLY